jgi:hypothetical protein
VTCGFVVWVAGFEPAASSAEAKLPGGLRASTFCFSGRTYPRLAQIVRALCAVAGRCWLSEVAVVAVTVAVTRDASAPSRLPPPAVVVMRRVPMAITD